MRKKTVGLVLLITILLISISILFFYSNYSVYDNEKSIVTFIEEDLNIEEVSILQEANSGSYKIVLFNSINGTYGLYIFNRGILNMLDPFGVDFGQGDKPLIQKLNGEIVVIADKNINKETKTIEVIYDNKRKQKSVNESYLALFDIKSSNNRDVLTITLYGLNNKILLENKTVY
jgi:hypothetical protein